jgi:hypothetical protein
LLDPLPKPGQKVLQPGSILVDGLFGGQGSKLNCRERIAARVREESVQTSGKMEQVKPDRGRAAGACPQLDLGKILDDPIHVLAYLLQGVRSGLELRLDPVDRPAEPDFRKVVHSWRVV